MAVRKSDLEGKLTEMQGKAADALEKAIDQKLSTEWRKGETIQVDIKPKNLHQKVIEEVTARFKAAGWKVKSDSSQRDHRDWLEFS